MYVPDNVVACLKQTSTNTSIIFTVPYYYKQANTKVSIVSMAWKEKIINLMLYHNIDTWLDFDMANFSCFEKLTTIFFFPIFNIFGFV